MAQMYTPQDLKKFNEDAKRRKDLGKTPAPGSTTPATPGGQVILPYPGANNTPAAPAPVAPNYMGDIQKLYPEFFANNAQIQSAASQVLPMYQAQLGGYNSEAMAAMRGQASQQLNNQYGGAIRASMAQNAQAGVRGPAAAAAANDIRNQQGLAQSNFEQGLASKQYDAQNTALGNYYRALATERGGVLGTLGGLQQLQNVQTGNDQYTEALKQMLAQQDASDLQKNKLLNPSSIWENPSQSPYVNPLAGIGMIQSQFGA